MEIPDYNEELIHAISTYDIAAVKQCLENGADPNYAISLDGVESSNINQPTTPLKLVMFRISDCLLDDSDLSQYLEITKILLSFGADPKPAMQIAESRYGIYDPGCIDTLFKEIWQLIANAIQK